MKPKVLKSESDYRAALRRVEALMDATPGSRDEEELELWSLLVEHYEEKHYPIESPDPVDAILFRMEQLGIRQTDLVRHLPHKSKVSEVLNRKRPLSLNMIRALHKGLGIPAEILVREPRSAYPSRKRRPRRKS